MALSEFFPIRLPSACKDTAIGSGKGRYQQAQAPWEGLANGFTLLFDAFLLELARIMPIHQVCKLFGVSDHKLWSLLTKYTDWGREAADNSSVESIGMDETAARRGHDYVTLFVGLDERRTLYVTEGKDIDTTLSLQL